MNVIKPWLDREFMETEYVRQQDSASSHKAMALTVQDRLAANLCDFWLASMWPPSFPDLNSLVFSGWTVVERQARRTPHRNMGELKASVTAAWDNLSEDYINDHKLHRTVHSHTLKIRP